VGRTLWFGRFARQLSDSNVSHELANHVRLLTALVRSFPIPSCPWLVLKPMKPLGTRMLLQMSRVREEPSIFED
jgi:hypothetical protein